MVEKKSGIEVVICCGWIKKIALYLSSLTHFLALDGKQNKVKEGCRRVENQTALTPHYSIFTVNDNNCGFKCCCCKKLWDSVIFFTLKKGGPAYTMLKETRKEALRHLLCGIKRIQPAFIMVFTEILSGHFTQLKIFPSKRDNSSTVNAEIGLRSNIWKANMCQSCLFANTSGNSLSHFHSHTANNMLLIQVNVSVSQKYLKRTFQNTDLC